MIIQKLKKVLIFVILLISFFGMNLEEGKAGAPCPPGTTESSPPIMIPYGGCMFEVTYCVACSPTIGITYLALHSWAPVSQACYDANNLNAKMVHDFLNAWPFASTSNLNHVCGGPLKPCSEGVTEVIVWETICWQIELVNGRKFVRTCEMTDNYCSKIVRFCYDTQLQRIVKVSETPSIISGYPTCTVTYEDVLLEELTPQNPISSCFYFPDNMCGFAP